MKDPSSLLRTADPLRDESEREGLSAADAEAMRRVVIASIREAVAPRPIWRRPIPLAAAAALVAGVSGIVGHRLTTTRPEVQPSATEAIAPNASPDSNRRQLQFATPGGTRIIWVFDDNLRLQEPIP